MRFLKSQYPELTNALSTAKSPQQMFGAAAKTWLAYRLGVDAGKIYSISIMPCTAKKAECELPGMSSSGFQDVDLVLTTRELARMVRAERIDAAALPEEPFDEPLGGTGSGAGVIFGATGGVMEAALRTAYYLVEGKNPPPDTFRDVRARSIERGTWLEAAFELGGATLHCAVASGLGNARRLIKALKRGEAHYEFVEIMACPGGCAGGGGQPIDGSDREKAVPRGGRLYDLDAHSAIRFSHDNPAIRAIYQEYLDTPCSEKSERLLHCDHTAWDMASAEE